MCFLFSYNFTPFIFLYLIGVHGGGKSKPKLTFTVNWNVKNIQLHNSSQQPVQ